jgi:hypothetical protein
MADVERVMRLEREYRSAEDAYHAAMSEEFPPGTRVEFRRGRGFWRGTVKQWGYADYVVLTLDSGKEVGVGGWWLWKDAEDSHD